jgi:hypothetical protein
VCRNYSKKGEIVAFWVLEPIPGKAAQNHKIPKNS